MEHFHTNDKFISENIRSASVSTGVNDESKMEVVKGFNNELVSLYDIKPPISKAKMTAITKAAMKSVKFYKHVVHGVEKFILKCRPDYKIPGLYVIDSIVRQSRHQFGVDKDVFAPRFSKNLLQTFKNICLCPEDDKQKLVRVINLWQKHKVFSDDLLKKFLVMAEASEEELPDLYKDEIEAIQKSSKKSPSSGKKKKKSPAKPSLENTGVLTPLQNPYYSTMNSLNSTSRSLNFNESANKSTVDPSLIQQLQTLTTLLQQSNPAINVSPAASGTPSMDQVKFDKKLLEYDYGEEEEEAGTVPSSITPSAAPTDSIASILTNPEILRQLQTLQVQLSMAQAQAKQPTDQQSSISMEQQRMIQNQQMQTFNQTMMQHQYQQECNTNFYGSAFQNSAPEAGSLTNLDDDMDDKPEIIMEKHPTDPLEVIDLDHIATPPSEKSPRRSYSRSRSRSRSGSRSRLRRARNRRSRSRSWNRERSRDHERNEERRRRALPPIKRKHLAVCSTTLWVGHLSKLVQEQDLSDTFGEFGDIVSIDLIPPRGCAFLCMNRRQDADRALHRLKNTKIQGKAITIAWAPGKGMKGREWKDYWEVDYGVSYIPWSKLTRDTDYDLLEEGGMLDQETMPDWLKSFLEEKRKLPYSKSSKILYTPSGTDMDESSNEDDDNIMHSVSNMDMIIESTNGVPEQMIPLPDGPQPTSDLPPVSIPLPPGQNPTGSQSGPMNLPPPPNLLNPFGLPPRLLGPMGVLGGNFIPPLGVPPPVPGLLMSPQHMLNRLPPPFPGPPGLPIINPGTGHNTSLSQIPLPDSSSNMSSVTSTTSSDFKPAFGLTPPLLFPGNPNMKMDLPGNPNLIPIPRTNDVGSVSENNIDQILPNPFKNLPAFSQNANLGNKEERNEDTDYRILGDISNATMMNNMNLSENMNAENLDTNKNEDEDHLNYNRDRNMHDFDKDRGHRFHDRNSRNFDRDHGGDKYLDRNHRFGGNGSRSPFREGSLDNDRYKQDRDSFRRSRFESRDYKRGRDFRGGSGPGGGGRFRDQGPPPSRLRGRSRERDRYRDQRREYGDNENKSRRFEKRCRSSEKSLEDTQHASNNKKSRWSDKSVEEDWNEMPKSDEIKITLPPMVENWNNTIADESWENTSTTDGIGWNRSNATNCSVEENRNKKLTSENWPNNRKENDWNEITNEQNGQPADTGWQNVDLSNQNVIANATTEADVKVKTMFEQSKNDMADVKATNQDESTLLLDTPDAIAVPNAPYLGDAKDATDTPSGNDESNKDEETVNEATTNELNYDSGHIETNDQADSGNSFQSGSPFLRFHEPRPSFPNRISLMNRGGHPSLIGHFNTNSPSGPFPGLPNFQRSRFQGHRPHPSFFQGSPRHFPPFTDSRPPRPFMSSRSNNF